LDFRDVPVVFFFGRPTGRSELSIRSRRAIRALHSPVP
jgi:hypothetical protein